MNLDQLNQWLAANGGGDELQYTPIKMERIRNPNYGKPGHLAEDEFVERPVQQWVNKRTGAILKVDPGEDGSYTVYEQVEANPQSRSVNQQTVSAPANQPYIGIEDANAQGGIRWEPNKNYIQPSKNPDRVYGKPEWDEKTQTWYQPVLDASGKVIGNEPLPDGAFPSKQPDPTEKAGTPYKNHAGVTVQPIYDVKTGKLLRVDPLPEGAAPFEKPDPTKNTEIVTDKDGRRLEVIRNLDGTIKEERPIPRAASTTNQTRAKPLDSNAIYTGTAKALAAALTDVYNDDTIDDVERERRAKALIDQAKTMVDLSNSTLTAQENSLTNRTTQRGQDLQDISGRRSFAQSIFGDVLKQVGDAASYAPAGSGPTIAAALRQGLNLAQQYGEQLGAFNVVPRELPGVAIQQNDQRGLDGSFPNGQIPSFIMPTVTAMPSVAQPTMIPTMVAQAAPVVQQPPQGLTAIQTAPYLTMVQGGQAAPQNP